jgi:Arc/MetJ-type ribon-helix-helix transcriptional regulator
MTFNHTRRFPVAKSKIAITIESELVAAIDRLVKGRAFSSRSQAIETAVADQLARIRRTRLATECAKLDPAEERSMADEGLEADTASWEEY